MDAVCRCCCFRRPSVCGAQTESELLFSDRGSVYYGRDPMSRPSTAAEPGMEIRSAADLFSATLPCLLSLLVRSGFVEPQAEGGGGAGRRRGGAAEQAADRDADRARCEQGVAGLIFLPARGFIAPPSRCLVLCRGVCTLCAASVIRQGSGCRVPILGPATRAGSRLRGGSWFGSFHVRTVRSPPAPPLPSPSPSYASYHRFNGYVHVPRCMPFALSRFQHCCGLEPFRSRVCMYDVFHAVPLTGNGGFEGRGRAEGGCGTGGDSRGRCTDAQGNRRGELVEVRTRKGQKEAP